GFAEAHAVYAQLLEEHPELVVVLVVADPQDAGLDSLAEQFTLAWDPAGALAARLSVATLPTMFVIDRGGRGASVVNGWDEAIAAELMEAGGKVDAQKRLRAVCCTRRRSRSKGPPWRRATTRHRPRPRRRWGRCRIRRRSRRRNSWASSRHRRRSR